MNTPNYAIMRFAKYKGPEISRIEGHNERTKETYASNPDIDRSRSPLNYNLIHPPQHYRAEAERRSAKPDAVSGRTAFGWSRCFSPSAPATSMANHRMKSVPTTRTRWNF